MVPKGGDCRLVACSDAPFAAVGGLLQHVAGSIVKRVEAEGLRHDLETASRIQQTLLLGRPLLDLNALRAAALSVPSWQIDGDFYDFFAHDQHLDVLLGDVMGKGIPAALVGAATKHHFLRASVHLLAADPGRTPELREILTVVNEELVNQLEGLEYFVTLCYARFDLRKRELVFIDCGHTRTVHSRGDGTYALLQGENMPLGFSRDDHYAQTAVPFGTGDVFFFYSDGVTEARDAAGIFFGEARLAELVHAHREQEPGELVETVRRAVCTFTGAERFQDDLTCVAVKVTDAPAEHASTQAVLEITSDLKELARVRAFLRQTLARHFDLDAIAEPLAQLELALTEAVSNIIVHAYGRQPGRPIRVKADLFVNRLLIRVYHRVRPFDPDEAEPVDLSTPRENRMGLHIIRECVDRVHYFVTEHGEGCVHLVKIIKPQPA
jgi:sigma-B regulation protein RsbU (phosphoserine phosphatase)